MSHKIMHSSAKGTYACDYQQGEAVKLKMVYIPPRVQEMSVRTERGFQLSGGVRTLSCMSEGISDNGLVDYGIGDGYNNGGNSEGVGNGPHIFF